jgi:hypothetical protein
MKFYACLTIAVSALGLFSSTDANDYPEHKCSLPGARRCRTPFIIDECTESGRYIFIHECGQDESCKYCEISHGPHRLASVADLRYRRCGGLPGCEHILCTDNARGKSAHDTVYLKLFPGLDGRLGAQVMERGTESC